MKDTARVIVTMRCNRNCPGCCNNSLKDIPRITMEQLKDYKKVVITGGEPFLLGDTWLENFILGLCKQNEDQYIYLYTAETALWRHRKVLDYLDGITVTLHAECTDDDIRNLKDLPCYIKTNIDTRLFIDSRVYDRYDLSNIDFTWWYIVRKLHWKDYCDPADNEDLFILED